MEKLNLSIDFLTLNFKNYNKTCVIILVRDQTFELNIHAEHVTEKNSIRYTNDRLKYMIQQQLKQIQEQVSEIENIIQPVLEQTLAESIQFGDYSSGLQQLYSINTSFVQKHQ